MNSRQPSPCRYDLTDTVIQLKLEIAEARSRLDSSLHARRSALDENLVLKSQLEQCVREREKLIIELDSSNVSILQEENKMLKTRLDAIEREKDSWIYREGQLTSELKQTAQLLARQRNKYKRYNEQSEELHVEEKIQRVEKDSLRGGESNIMSEKYEKDPPTETSAISEVCNNHEENPALVPRRHASIGKVLNRVSSTKSSLNASYKLENSKSCEHLSRRRKSIVYFKGLTSFRNGQNDSSECHDFHYQKNLKDNPSYHKISFREIPNRSHSWPRHGVNYNPNDQNNLQDISSYHKMSSREISNLSHSWPRHGVNYDPNDRNFPLAAQNDNHIWRGFKYLSHFMDRNP